MGPLQFLYTLWWWVTSVWQWLSTPSVCPWVGVVAAIIAAIALEPLNWLKSPWEFVSRIIKVSIAWLLVAFFLSAIVQVGAGSGGQGEVTRSAQTETLIAGSKGVLAASRDTQIPTGPSIIAVIRFLPSVTDQKMAQAFSCDVFAGNGKSVRPSLIRATSMPEFEGQLRKTLTEVAVPNNVSRPEIHVLRVPYPGENVLRKVCDIAANAVPTAQVLIDEWKRHEGQR